MSSLVIGATTIIKIYILFVKKTDNLMFVNQ